MDLFLKENLCVLREGKSLTQQQFSDKLNIKKNTYGNYETGYSSPNFLILKQFAQYYGITVDELLYTQIAKERSDTIAKHVPPDVNQNVHPKGKEYTENDMLTVSGEPPVLYQPNVLDVEGKGAAGILQIVQETVKRKIALTLYYPNLGEGLHIRIPIAGDSMHPVIKDRDIVIATLVPQGSSGLREGHVYVAVDEEDGIICKRMYWAGQEHMELVSDNEVYKPYKRQVSHIVMLFKVQQVHSSNLHNYIQESRQEIARLWNAIEEIRQSRAG